MPPDPEAKPKVLPPSRFAHIVLRSNNRDQMADFYARFLGGHIVHRNDKLTFITYDDEHHRIAIIEMSHLRPKDYDTNGLEHIAYSFDSLRDLCTAYRQRKELGVEPGWCVVSLVPNTPLLVGTIGVADSFDHQNHGPTTSMYYRDPDGNMIETQFDNLSPDDATAFLEGPLFAKNPLGAEFDPEELCEALDRGEDEEELKQFHDVGPRDPEKELPGILEKMQAGKYGF